MQLITEFFVKNATNIYHFAGSNCIFSLFEQLQRRRRILRYDPNKAGLWYSRLYVGRTTELSTWCARVSVNWKYLRFPRTTFAIFKLCTYIELYFQVKCNGTGDFEKPLIHPRCEIDTDCPFSYICNESFCCYKNYTIRQEDVLTPRMSKCVKYNRSLEININHLHHYIQ